MTANRRGEEEEGGGTRILTTATKQNTAPAAYYCNSLAALARTAGGEMGRVTNRSCHCPPKTHTVTNLLGMCRTQVSDKEHNTRNLTYGA